MATANLVKAPFFLVPAAVRPLAHVQVALGMHRTQGRLLGGGRWAGNWEAGGTAGRGRMGTSESLLTVKPHSAVVWSPGCPELVLVGSGSQSLSCPGGLGRSLRQATWTGRAQTVPSGRPNMVSVQQAGSWGVRRV